jgi:hypothetical protein
MKPARGKIAPAADRAALPAAVVVVAAAARVEAAKADTRNATKRILQIAFLNFRTP